jgi:uncharacterized membrane protein
MKTEINKYIQKIFQSKRLKKILIYSKKYKIKIKSLIIAVIGFVLSPLSWWNDLFVNIPLAYLFALPFGFISESYFLPAMVVGYWITNILGFVLLHYGIIGMLKKEKKKYSKKQIITDLIISILYTILVVLLVRFEILKLPSQYF